MKFGNAKSRSNSFDSIHSCNPYLANITRADDREFCCCVLWLEDQRIRHFGERERDARLRNGSGGGDDTAQWEAGSLGGDSTNYMYFGPI